MPYRAASLALAPVLYLQGRHVRRVTPRLPEPPGAREGIAGTGEPLRLLMLGDSSAAGVGASSQREALSGQLVACLAPHFRVSWSLVARTGATTAGTARHLARVPGTEFDIVVVALGLNDVTSRRPLAQWLSDVDSVVHTLRTRFLARYLLLCGPPPMHLLPALPQPLRWYLGSAARQFDEALARWTEARPYCEHVPLRMEGMTHGLATDGLHPRPVLYEKLGDELAQRVRNVRQSSAWRSGATHPVRASHEESRSAE